MKTLSIFLLVALLVADCQMSQAQDFLTNGLIAYLPFYGTANDNSGQGIGGITAETAYVKDRFGKTNCAISFDGTTNNFISTSFWPPYGNADRTFSIWFNTTNPNWGAMVSYGLYNVLPCYNCAGDGFQIGITGGNLYFAADSPYLTTQRFFNDGKWHQVTLVITSNYYNPSDKVILYADGVRQSWQQVGGIGTTLINTFQGGSTLYIGGIQQYGVPVPYTYFSGLLDDIRIYNRALSSSEVAQLYATESHPPFWPLFTKNKTVYAADYSLIIGSNYLFKYSADLQNWTAPSPAFTATSSYWQSTNFWSMTNQPQMFFMLSPE